MRFHGLMLLRDEADIIAENLAHLLTWIDVLHVYDLGSTDGTWEIVNDLAAREPRIVPFLREPTVYHDALRCVLFDRLRADFAPGDWVVKIDADEFYPVPPPRFVGERLEPADGMVHLQWYFFRLTTAEADAYGSGAVSVSTERDRPIGERRRFYKISRYSEPRMFRYRTTMRWPQTVHWPFNAGLTARERLPILHYPHRDPPQMAARFALRAAMMRRQAEAGGHWNTADWKGELVDPTTGVALGAKGGKGLTAENNINSGPLYFWPPGESLPEVHLREHMPGGGKRLVQRGVHAALLPLLDRRRSGFDPAYRPQVLSEAENSEIGDVCAAAARASQTLLAPQ